jgi:hypothetical protein
MSCQGCTLAHTGQPNGTCAPRIPAMTNPTVSACAGACPQGYAQCSGATVCSRISWDFETHPSVTNYDFSNGDWASGDNSNLGADALDYQMKPPGQVHGGQWAARIRSNSPPATWTSGVQVGLCPAGGSLDLRGRNVTFWFYFDGPQVTRCSDVGCNGFTFKMYDSVGIEQQVDLGTPQFGHWYQATFTVGSTATAAESMGVQCDLDAWAGTLYIDDVSIQ